MNNQTIETSGPAQGEASDDLLHGEARTDAIVGMRALLDLLEADAALPLPQFAFHFYAQPRDAGIDQDATAEAVCWLGTVAGALGVDVADHVGSSPSSETDIYKASRRFGDHVRYEAVHITPEFRAEQDAKAAAGGES
ncbi:hypothetical protein [Glycomyces artemisiae]|uniref:Uncharacterized protein n=1 Tax=Glycomyces artemisiae TaxID=1076443 RepID=A0A2T0UF63_9ACTN|nr:hypothetical protein [Glycomyces artemisiae]PRY56488.1 hypothetical protein B0I28_109137 [Glycomyces artemisiae]